MIKRIFAILLECTLSKCNKDNKQNQRVSIECIAIYMKITVIIKFISENFLNRTSANYNLYFSG